MMDGTGQLPRHIARLIEDVRGSSDLEASLKLAAPHCQRDVSLLHIFRSLGYSPDSERFLRPLDRKKILDALLDEYSAHSAFESLELWESSHAVKSELFRTFIDNKFDELSPPEHLGLVDYCLPDLGFGMEDNTLSTMWSYAEPPIDLDSQESSPSLQSSSVFPSSRMSRGLRLISVRVKELVAIKKQTSYKEVADQLINELALPPGPDQFKEEKNVRRRVYDALNVLVSAGVVDKVGKLVTWRKSQSLKRQQVDEQNYLSDKRRAAAEKREHLSDLVHKTQALKRLIERNQAHPGEVLMPLPFIVVAPVGALTSLGVKADSTNSHVAVRLSQQFDLLPDLEVLTCLDFPLEWEGVPPDIKRLCKIPVIKH